MSVSVQYVAAHDMNAAARTYDYSSLDQSYNTLQNLRQLPAKKRPNKDHSRRVKEL